MYIFDLDLVRAKAKFAELINGVLPKINRHKTLIKRCLHPLLWLRNKVENKTIYPNSDINGT
jgi:DNA mismatch repair protein MutS2